MPRVVAFVPDLLFGSRAQGLLAAGGHEVTLAGGEEPLRAALPGAEVLVVDLTADADAHLALLASLRDDGSLDGVRTLGFFAHVEPEVRERALAQGVDQVVPRSRFHREGAELVTRLAAG